MGRTVLPEKEIKTIHGRQPIGPFRGWLALAILWLVNLLVILFGWPFLLYGKLKFREPRSQDK